MMSEKDIPSPSLFFGFKMGEDKKIARWDKIVDYFLTLGKRSDRIKVVELGKSTEGNPYLLAIVSAPENIRNLERLKHMSWRIAHPRGMTEEELQNILCEGKTVVEITNSMHATEIGGTQMAPELAYELVTSEEPVFQKIRENTVLLLVPCYNPDGEIMVADWYNKYLGTEYEGIGQPWLYHKYVGHDNNRDMIMQNMVETRFWADLTFKEWYPQAYMDHHHMGSYAGRFYVPPESPGWIDVNIDPLIWTEERLYGGNMADRLEAAGCLGIEYETFVDEFMTTTNHVARRLNICGMLTESASAKLATPIYIHFQQLLPGDRLRPEYNPQTNFPHPWPGGWWRLGDIVKQQKVASLAILEVAAVFRERILKNMYTKAKRSIERGEEEPPFAFIVPPDQHDILTSYRLLEAYKGLGVEIHRAKQAFTTGGVTYPAGTYVIFASQTARPYLLATLQKNVYQDIPWNRTGEGAPIPTKDPATTTLAEYMGVKVIAATEKPQGDFEEIRTIEYPAGSLEGTSGQGYLLDARLNATFGVANRLLHRGLEVHKADEDVTTGGKLFPRGSFFMPSQKGLTQALREEAEKTHVTFCGLEGPARFKKHKIKRLKIAIYQRYYGGNMQEGWTRWILEQNDFDITTVKDKEVKEGLKDKYDVLVLPSDPTPMITGEKLEEYFEKRSRGAMPMPVYPPEYRSGIGKDGVEKVKEFVESGGVLVTLNEASSFALEELKLPIINVVKDLKPTDFLCSGSTLRVEVDNNHALGYGLPKDWMILSRGEQAYAIKAGNSNEDYRIVARYPDRLIMQSGWLIGEKHLSRKACLVEAKLGKGRVVLFGFEPLYRGQTHGSFKFFFNALT